MKNIRQNLFFGFIYNLLGVPLAAGVLYPWLGLLLNPMLAFRGHYSFLASTNYLKYANKCLLY
jgi:cation transport ATPase